MTEAAVACPFCGQAPGLRALLREMQGEGASHCVSCPDEDSSDCNVTAEGEWSNYPLGKEGYFQGRQEFESVWHVTHVDSAIRIIRNDEIETKSVFRPDYPNLRGCWAGLDSFSNGSFFGNVAFDLDFRTLIQGKSIHWATPLQHSIRRFRFIISDREWIPGVCRYDPAADDRRPWYWDQASNRHFSRGDSKYGFFFDHALSRSSWKAIGFVDHHPWQCLGAPGTCEYLGVDRTAARKKFERLLRKGRLDTLEVVGLIS